MSLEQKTAQKLYGKLVSLYPRAFRQRLGESMQQTFDDLYTVLDAHKPDDIAKVTVARGEDTTTLQVKVVVLNPASNN